MAERGNMLFLVSLGKQRKDTKEGRFVYINVCRLIYRKPREIVVLLHARAHRITLSNFIYSEKYINNRNVKVVNKQQFSQYSMCVRIQYVRGAFQQRKLTNGNTTDRCSDSAECSMFQINLKCCHVIHPSELNNMCHSTDKMLPCDSTK